MDEALHQGLTQSHDDSESVQWKPLSAVQRRIVGVLAEKAKTTPDAYPMTLNGLTNGCNQKSNRVPQMSLTTDDVEDSMEELREMGAVVEVQGGGRVNKYRHRLYDWLGVNKVELAVMAELLLRGEQTIGELRGRAARMEPIADLGTLRPILRDLIEKQLVLSLTPEGRGQVVTHNLYPPQERTAVRESVAAGEARAATTAASTSPIPPRPTAGDPSVPPAQLAELHKQMEQLQAELHELRQRVETLESGRVVPER